MKGGTLHSIWHLRVHSFVYFTFSDDYPYTCKCETWHRFMLSLWAFLFPSNLKHCWVEPRLAWNCECKSANHLQPGGLPRLCQYSPQVPQRAGSIIGYCKWLDSLFLKAIHQCRESGCWGMIFLKVSVGTGRVKVFQQIATGLVQNLKLRNDSGMSCYLTQDVIDAGHERTSIIESCTIQRLIFTSASL